MNAQFQFPVTIIQDDDVAIAQLHATDEHVDIIGSAKRHPKDEPDLIIGQVLALGRMFRNLADHYDDVAVELLEEAATVQREEEPPPPDDDSGFYAQYGIPSAEMG